MPTLRVIVKWSNNPSPYAVERIDATTEFSINELDINEIIGNWLIETRHWNGSWWVQESIRVDNCRLPEALQIEHVVCPSHGAPAVRMANVRAWEMLHREVLYYRWANGVRQIRAFLIVTEPKTDLGRLAIQIEHSYASIEGRQPRRFLGLGVRCN